MNAVLELVSVLVGASGLVVLLLASWAGQWRQGLRAMLDLWLAAALLGLAGGAGGPQLAAAASILVLRRVVAVGLRANHSPLAV